MQAEQWAVAQCGTLELGDTRRTRRVVELAAAMFRQPDASLPQPLGAPVALKATYRLLNTEALRHTPLLAPWTCSRFHPPCLRIKASSPLAALRRMAVCTRGVQPSRLPRGPSAMPAQRHRSKRSWWMRICPSWNWKVA